jgi:Poly(R)-hydroxyalkanoic acid synthase subunit (PHA_synth_III_E)
MNLRRRGLEHNAIVLQAWLQAGRRFSEQLAGRSDPKSLDAKAALALWTDTANQQLLETQRSEPFLQSQAGMIRATTELRMAQQELVEHFGKQYGFPTRTELDDVHRTVTELRREMRAMRREHRLPAQPASTRPEATPSVAPPPVAPQLVTPLPAAAAQPEALPAASPAVVAQPEATPKALKQPAASSKPAAKPRPARRPGARQKATQQ